MAAYITKQQLAERIIAAKLALDALNAKDASLKLSKYATAMAVPQIGSFQKIEGNLKVDNLYGVNTKAAITWYLQSYPKPQSIPAVNPKWINQPLTWNPPTLEPAPKTPSEPKAKTTTKKKKTKKKPVVSQTTTKTPAVDESKYVPTSKSSSSGGPSLSDEVAKAIADARKTIKSIDVPVVTGKMAEEPESLNTDTIPKESKAEVKTAKSSSTKKKTSSKKVTKTETSKSDSTIGKIAIGFLVVTGLIYALA